MPIQRGCRHLLLPRKSLDELGPRRSCASRQRPINPLSHGGERGERMCLKLATTISTTRLSARSRAPIALLQVADSVASFDQLQGGCAIWADILTSNFHLATHHYLDGPVAETGLLEKNALGFTDSFVPPQMECLCSVKQPSRQAMSATPRDSVRQRSA